MKKGLEIVNSNDFDALYLENSLPQFEKLDAFFEDAIQAVEDYSCNPSFWYIGDFRTGTVVKCGGEVKQCSSFSTEQFIGITPAELEQLIHPDDRKKMMTYIVFIASFLASKSEEERKKYKPSLVFRFKNDQNIYTWRTMHYPKMRYVDQKPQLLLCVIEEIHHYSRPSDCCMYILERSTGSTVMYFCNDETATLKEVITYPIPSKRELEVLSLLSRGKISKEIAVELGIAKNTVENHKQKMFEKFGVRKVTELISVSIKMGWVLPS
ncbi:MAG: LuxR C-terminal-related transcriptional regulator [Bacteroidota bacterium]